MNRIQISLLVGLVFLCCNLNAQKVTVEGQILDSINNPLELANVIAINKNTNGIASYGITDAQGRYRLNLKKDSVYLLRASYLGFETWEKSFIASANILKNVILKASANQLDGVTVVEEFPVTISGDTITYKADAFTTGKEKKLENILEQLPGFEIDDEGQIKVQGKSVSKVLVEGKEFFDGDTKMATKNIPANAVDKVQVLRDFNDIGPLSGVNDSDDIALNIKLKEGKKNLWFGDVTAGGGPKERYVSHPNLFYYSPKLNINFIGDLNNVGEQAFTLQDYFRFNGGLSSLSKRSGSSVNLSGDDAGLSLLQNNRSRNTVSKLAALNFNYTPNKKIRFSGFGIVSGVDTDLSSVSQRTYLKDTGNNTELLTSNIRQKNSAGLFKISSTFTPNSKWHLSYDAFVKNSEIDDRTQSISSFLDLDNAIASNNLKDPFSIQQMLSVYYAKDEKNIFSLESNQLYKRQRPTYNLLAIQQPFQGILELQNDSPFNLIQDKEVFTNTFDAEFNYYKVLNKTNHISFKAGVTINRQKLTSTFMQEAFQNNSTLGDDMEFVNDSRFDFLDTYFGLGYRLKLGKLTLSPTLNFHVYDIENSQFNNIVEINKSLLLPEFRGKYTFNSSQSLQFDYKLAAEFADIQNLAPATQLVSYNSLFRGNLNLENSWYHNLSLNYFNFSMFNFTNIHGGFTYQKRYNNVGTLDDFIGLNRVSIASNIYAPNEMLTFFGTYERKFPLWKGKFETQWSYNKFSTVIDQVNNFNRSFNQKYKISLETRFKESPNVELGFEKKWNDYTSSSIKNRFITNSPFANVEAYFLHGFAFTADYQYNNYQSKTGEVKSVYDFLNAALYYQKEDTNWEFKISGLNLLNTNSIRQDSFSNNFISTLEYQVQPRYFLLSVKYEL
jgi:hypothetical protein